MEPKYDKMRPPDDWKDFELEFFEHSDGNVIGTLSMGLEKEEALDYFNIEYDELEAPDQFFFDCHYQKGRALAKNKAVSAMFDQMKGKAGTTAALEYLVRFADKWPEKEGDASTRGRTFKFVVDS